MGLESYDELREKVVTQMHEQAKDVKTIMVEQWARDNGFENVAFNNYDEAQEWVNENVNKKRKLKKSFYKFETEADDALSSIMQELEEGSSSEIMRRVKHISNKYVTPAAKIVLKSVIMSQVSGLALHYGLAAAGNVAHLKALDAIDKFKLFDFNPDLHVDVPQIGDIVNTSSLHLGEDGAFSVVTKGFNNTIDTVGDAINSIPSAITSTTQNAVDSVTDAVTNAVIDTQNRANFAATHTLLKGELGVKSFYDSSVVPFLSKVSGVAFGLIEGKNATKKAIKDHKKSEEKKKDEKSKQSSERRSDALEDRIDELEKKQANAKEIEKKKNEALLELVQNGNNLSMQEIQLKLIQIIAESNLEKEPDTVNDTIEKKKNITMRNVGKTQQTQFTISQMQELFKKDGITIPDMPEDVANMEDYGKYLRNYLKQNNYSKDDQSKIFTAIKIYETEVGKCCRDLKMGKSGIIKRTREVLDVGMDELFNGFSRIGNRAQYSMKRMASNSVKHTKESDVQKAENEVITQKQGELAYEASMLKCN